MAQHKGYGLALCLDILSGLISGASYSNDVGKFYSEDNSCMNVGQTFIAIDPTIIDSPLFFNKVDDYINKIHDSEAIDKSEILYPGERKNISRLKSKLYGLDINEALWNELMYLKSVKK